MSTVEDILHDVELPAERTTILQRLYESGMEIDEADMTIEAECVTENGSVVGLKRNGDDSESLDISTLEQPPGEPTGEYFDGKRIVDESELDETETVLPVLEDVGHPLVPELNHEYYPRPMDHGHRTDVEVVVRALADPNYSVLLIGETGVGKNVLLKHIWEQTNWPSQRVNFGLGTDYESLVGRFAPSDAESGVKDTAQQAKQVAEEMNFDESDVLQAMSAGKSYFEFVSGVLRQCVRNGYAFEGDEINTVVGEVTSSLHGVTEEADSRELVVQDTAEVNKPDPRFKFCGTMNPIDYAGTNELNKAFQTRFYPIHIPYLRADAEVQVLMEKSWLGAHPNGQQIAEGLVNLANSIRSQKGGAGDGSGTIMTAVSSRDLIKIGNMTCGPDGTEFMDPKAATRLILEGVAAPGDWSSISTVVDRTSFQ